MKQTPVVFAETLDRTLQESTSDSSLVMEGQDKLRKLVDLFDEFPKTDKYKSFHAMLVEILADVKNQDWRKEKYWIKRSRKDATLIEDLRAMSFRRLESTRFFEDQVAYDQASLRSLCDMALQAIHDACTVMELMDHAGDDAEARKIVLLKMRKMLYRDGLGLNKSMFFRYFDSKFPGNPSREAKALQFREEFGKRCRELGTQGKGD